MLPAPAYGSTSYSTPTSDDTRTGQYGRMRRGHSLPAASERYALDAAPWHPDAMLRRLFGRSSRQVNTSVLTLGSVCVIAAIVGGGLTAAGMEIPVVDSVTRQVLLGLVGVGLTLLSFTALGQNPGTTGGDPKHEEPEEPPRQEVRNVPQPRPTDEVKLRRIVTTAADGTRTETSEYFDDQLAREVVRQDSFRDSFGSGGHLE